MAFKAKGIVEPVILEPDVHAFIALSRGEASAEQQRRASEWLLAEGCRLMSDTVVEVKESGSTDLDHDVAFANGRRHVGVLMRRMLLPETLELAKKITDRERAGSRPPTKPESPRDRLLKRT